MFGGYMTPLSAKLGRHQDTKKMYSETAKVGFSTIIFVARPELDKDVRVYSTNNDSTGYKNLDRSEVENGTTAKVAVRIDNHKNYVDGEAPTPIVFTGTGDTVKRDMPGGKETTRVFEFKYVIPHIDTKEWTFTKTKKIGGIPQLNTPDKPDEPDPDDIDPDPEEDGGWTPT